MKDIIKILSLLTVLGSFFMTSCRQDSKFHSSPREADTYVSVSLAMNSSSFRGEEDNYNRVGTWNGKDQVQSIDVFLLDDAKVHRVHYVLGDLSVDNRPDGTVLIKPKRAIRTTSGQKKIYALVNAPAKVLSFLENFADPTDFPIVWNNNPVSDVPISDVASRDDQKKEDKVMSSCTEPVALNVKPDISEDQALTTTDNHIKITVKRTVARVLVTSTQKSYEVVVNGRKLGTLSELTYSAAQWEKGFYIGQKINSKNLIESPQYQANYGIGAGYSQDSRLHYVALGGGFYDYSDLFVKDRVVPVFAKGKLTDPNKDIDPAWLSKSIFMNETTHPYQRDPTNRNPANYDGYYKRGNTPYVLVRGVFVPENFADNGKYTRGETFYLGANNRFYTSVENVTDPEKGGIVDQSYKTYTNGKVLYFAYMNADDTDTPLESPIFRNSVYHLSIKGVSGLGLNWNPLYPEKVPEHPDLGLATPNPDPHPDGTPSSIVDFHELDYREPLSPLPILVNVDVTVIPWNVTEYEDIFGNN